MKVNINFYSTLFRNMHAVDRFGKVEWLSSKHFAGLQMQKKSTFRKTILILFHHVKILKIINNNLNVYLLYLKNRT